MRLLPPRLVVAAVGAMTTALLTGCPDREVSKVDPAQDKAELKEIPVDRSRKLDILFLVDNSNSMGQEQANLRRNFPRFIETLGRIGGGLPDIHIGVISSDMGAGKFSGARDCKTNANGDAVDTGLGDNGALVMRDECAGRMTNPGDKFLTKNGDDQNFTGDLAEQFSCMADLGTGGCGFEQSLESIRKALEPATNPGFLRDDAFLAVVILTDEDDCSAQDDYQLFNTTNERDLGPRTSYRCFKWGVKCAEAGDAAGPRTNCQSAEDSPYLKPVGYYIDELKKLKADPKKIVVAGIIGLKPQTLLPEPVAVGIANSRPELLEVCQTTGTGSADPGVRLKKYFDAFPDRNTTVTICDEDLSTSLTLIAQLLTKVLGNPCIEGNLRDVNPGLEGDQFDCAVADVQNAGEDNEVETIIPSCEANGGTAPCWVIQPNPEVCQTAPNLEITVTRSSSPPDGTVQRVQCVVGDEVAAGT